MKTDKYIAVLDFFERHPKIRASRLGKMVENLFADAYFKLPDDVKRNLPAYPGETPTLVVENPFRVKMEEMLEKIALGAKFADIQETNGNSNFDPYNPSRCYDKEGTHGFGVNAV